MPSAKIVFINFYNKQTLPNQVVVLKANIMYANIFANYNILYKCIFAYIYKTPKFTLQFSSLIPKKKGKKGIFFFLHENCMSNTVKFKANNEKVQNELSEENIQKPPYVFLFLPFIIHESRGSCYRQKLHMKQDSLFIFNKENG